MPYTLNLGPVKLAWDFDADNLHWQEFLAGYRNYLDHSNGDLTLAASVLDVLADSPRPRLPNSFIRERNIEGDRFDLGDGLITGSLPRDNRCHCVIHPVLLHGSGLRVLEQFFYLLFHHVTRSSGRELTAGPFLLHSSSVLQAGTVKIFCGPAGSGKSTAASLSSPRAVLTDECTVLQATGDGLAATGSPINPFCPEKIPGHGPVASLYLLRQAEQHRLVELPRQAAVPRLAAEIITPVGLTDRVVARGLVRALDLALLLYSRCHVQELQFRRDAEFWQLLDDAEVTS
ncbi:MAG: hypothetical protein ABIF77_12510 [bacterium]